MNICKDNRDFLGIHVWIYYGFSDQGLHPILITLFLHLFHVLNKCWTNVCLYPAF